MKFQHLLSDLGANIGLSSLQADENGVCRLVFNGQISIDMETDNEVETSLIMHTVTGRLRAEDKRSLCLELLDGNYLGHTTNGSVLGLNTTTDEVVMHRRVRLEGCDPERLATELTALATTAMEWTKRLSTRETEAQAPAGIEIDPLGAGMGMIRV